MLPKQIDQTVFTPWTIHACKEKRNHNLAVPGDADVPAGEVPAALPAVPGVPGVVPEDTPWDAANLAAAAEAAAAAESADPAGTDVDSGTIAIIDCNPSETRM